MRRRFDLVRRLLDERGEDALLVYGSGRWQPDVQWISNWPGGREGYVLFPRRGDPTLLVQFFNHLPTARTLSAFDDTRWVGPDGAATAASLIRERGLRSVGVAGALSFRSFETLRSASGAALSDANGPYRSLRLVRSSEEMARFRYAAWLTDLSMEAVARELRPGFWLDELPAVVEPEYLWRGGYAGIHFFSAMPMEGPFASVPSQYPPHRRLGRGDVLISEVTGCYAGYLGQIHRTYSLGVEPDAAWRRLHDVARETFEGVAATLTPGRRVEEVLAAAGHVEASGFTIVDDLVHGADQLPPVLRTPATSHQPYPADMEIAEGMVLVVQPNVVEADSGRGLQFGETLEVTAEGAVTLHAFPRAWTVVEAAG